MKLKDKIISLAVMLLMIGLDQLTKYWALTDLRGRPPVELWKNVFHFVYAENRGAAFSILQNRRIFLIIFTAVAIGAVLYVVFSGRMKLNMTATLGLTLIAAGGIGNLIDRIFRSFVVDFIYFVPIDFPVFNVADSCVTIGAIVFGVGFIVAEVRRARAAKQPAQEE